MLCEPSEARQGIQPNFDRLWRSAVSISPDKQKILSDAGSVLRLNFHLEMQCEEVRLHPTTK